MNAVWTFRERFGLLVEVMDFLQELWTFAELFGLLEEFMEF